MAQMNGTGSIDFDYIGRIILITLGLYLVSALFCLHPGLDHGERLHQYRLPLPPRHLGEDQPHAAQVL